jgi:hypothetical protein
MKPFGIGAGFEDMKANAACNTVQKENVWQPFYEVTIDEMDFKDKIIAAKQAAASSNVEGVNIEKIQAELNKHDEEVKLKKTEDDLIKSGLAPKKVFNLQDKLRMLKAKDADKEEEKVIDPYTVKVRKFHSEMNDRDLQEIMSKYGAITRCRVPMDQEQPHLNRGIGFVTYQRSEDVTKVLEEGSIIYEFYELPVERAFYSAGMAERNRGGGGGW